MPRVANRQSAADAAVHFVKVDEASAEEIERLQKLNVLIKEKHIPIANLDNLKSSEVVEKVQARLPSVVVSMTVHTRAWRYYKVRPSTGDAHPDRTRSEYCIYDETHEDYVYTKAWVEKLVRDLADPAEYARVNARIFTGSATIRAVAAVAASGSVAASIGTRSA